MRDEGKSFDTYTHKDKKYMIPAATVTMRRFGPSGSLKKKNIAREKMRDVITKIISEVFLDRESMR